MVREEELGTFCTVYMPFSYGLLVVWLMAQKWCTRHAKLYNLASNLYNFACVVHHLSLVHAKDKWCSGPAGARICKTSRTSIITSAFLLLVWMGLRWNVHVSPCKQKCTTFIPHSFYSFCCIHKTERPPTRSQVLIGLEFCTNVVDSVSM